MVSLLRELITFVHLGGIDIYRKAVNVFLVIALLLSFNGSAIAKQPAKNHITINLSTKITSYIKNGTPKVCSLIIQKAKW
ncbi:hypothetical protein [Alkalihalobacillus sp. TS-13]|uniref:hypothetical protein n=1 Tax=Alkalihalobacillus sp. TS-13 TaxID=2842455 RepID=UPI001C86D4FF|nr:hypothetical protein [Alkalihalobacillus sp. TS-13]